MEVLIFFAGILMGIIVCYLIVKNTSLKKLSVIVSEQKEELITLKAQSLNTQQIEEQTKVLFENLANKIFNENRQELSKENQEKLTEIVSPIAQKLADFEVLSNKLLKENTSELKKENQEQILKILAPFKENLLEFGQKMEHIKTQNTSLTTQIEMLKTSSDSLSSEAKNLANALKGNAKIRGDWGEIILKRILEASGLEENLNYTMQDSFGNLRTDCIIKLPENKNIIIDSKVSLVPLQNYYQAEDEASQKQALKDLEMAIKTNIDSLDKKSYQDIKEVESADYVLMFMPVESAFNLMMNEFDGVLDYAWKKSVLIVSPSSLMVALRTVEMFWRQEKQNKNCQEIVKVGANLYDKFVGFISDIESVSSLIKRSQDTLDNATKKLTGHGGLCSQVNKLKELGARPKKELPKELIEVE